jgi:hypothetical protein
MKTKTLIKAGTILTLLLVSVIFCSCEEGNVATEKTTTILGNRRFEIYTIDSCEYIGTVTGSNTDVLAHKGNCKFCVERNKK